MTESVSEARQVLSKLEASLLDVLIVTVKKGIHVRGNTQINSLFVFVSTICSSFVGTF